MSVLNRWTLYNSYNMKKSNLCIDFSQITRASIFIYQRFSRWSPFWHFVQIPWLKISLHCLRKSIIKLHSNGKILLVNNQPQRFVNRKSFVAFAVLRHYSSPLLSFPLKMEYYNGSILGCHWWKLWGTQVVLYETSAFEKSVRKTEKAKNVV